MQLGPRVGRLMDLELVLVVCLIILKPQGSILPKSENPDWKCNSHTILIRMIFAKYQ